jgi:hypothetical protein
MSDITTTAVSISINVTGVAFMVSADRYMDVAAICLEKSKKTEGFDPVPYYLLCQSLELHLKSFIWLSEKISNKTIKNRYGHNIEKLWDHAKSKGINSYAKITPLRNSVISLVGPYYKNRQLSYLDIEMVFSGYRKLLNEPRILPTLVRLNGQLSKELRTPILSAS